MQSRSLLLDTGTWDILLDDTGNLAITDNPHAVARGCGVCVQYLSGGVLVRLNVRHTLLVTHPRTLARHATGECHPATGST